MIWGTQAFWSFSRRLNPTFLYAYLARNCKRFLGAAHGFWIGPHESQAAKTVSCSAHREADFGPSLGGSSFTSLDTFEGIPNERPKLDVCLLDSKAYDVVPLFHVEEHGNWAIIRIEVPTSESAILQEHVIEATLAGETRQVSLILIRR